MTAAHRRRAVEHLKNRRYSERRVCRLVGFSLGANHPSVKPLLLNMIEGMTNYDIFRMEELGIDTCYDLANADFVPLLLKTSYGARELIDWLLQARLCVRFGDGVFELRERGIRTVTDFADLDDAYLENLARETSLMLPNLKQVTQLSVSHSNIERLKRAAERLGHYWEGEDDRDRQQVVAHSCR